MSVSAWADVFGGCASSRNSDNNNNIIEDNISPEFVFSTLVEQIKIGTLSITILNGENITYNVGDEIVILNNCSIDCRKIIGQNILICGGSIKSGLIKGENVILLTENTFSDTIKAENLLLCTNDVSIINMQTKNEFICIPDNGNTWDTSQNQKNVDTLVEELKQQNVVNDKFSIKLGNWGNQKNIIRRSIRSSLGKKGLTDEQMSELNTISSKYMSQWLSNNSFANVIDASSTKAQMIFGLKMVASVRDDIAVLVDRMITEYKNTNNTPASNVNNATNNTPNANNAGGKITA